MTYPWGDDRRFNSYAGYFRRLFGGRVQKLSVDAGFTCPNRDGTLGRGGCTFCDNGAFTPSYCRSAKSITQQIDEGIAFHARRYRSAGRYLVYFQSYSNTYAPLERLRALYGEALAHPQVAGIVVGRVPTASTRRSLTCWPRWRATATWPSSTASSQPRTRRCALSAAATTSPAPAVPWSSPPGGGSTSGRTSSSGSRARATRCCSARSGPSTRCRSRRSSSTSCSSSAARPWPPSTTPTRRASASGPPGSTSTSSSRCCAACGPTWWSNALPARLLRATTTAPDGDSCATKHSGRCSKKIGGARCISRRNFISLQEERAAGDVSAHPSRNP